MRLKLTRSEANYRGLQRKSDIFRNQRKCQRSDICLDRWKCRGGHFGRRRRHQPGRISANADVEPAEPSGLRDWPVRTAIRTAIGPI